MSIGWLQLAWVAAGDVNFNFMDEALSVDGNWENIQGGKEQANGRVGKRGWMLLAQVDGMHQGRMHAQLMTGENSVEGMPRTLTVRPESPRPAQLTCCPVEAAVALTLSAGRVRIQADTPVITRGIWASRAGWKRWNSGDWTVSPGPEQLSAFVNVLLTWPQLWVLSSISLGGLFSWGHIHIVSLDV